MKQFAMKLEYDDPGGHWVQWCSAPGSGQEDEPLIVWIDANRSTGTMILTSQSELADWWMAITRDNP